jgi:hypothetical protein
LPWARQPAALGRAGGLAKLAAPRGHRCPWPKCLPHDWSRIEVRGSP